ncbi:sensor domain-containing protein [Variovorax ginsengisoli]|uniref:Diguanylate cyclase (GGDEF)-like protein/PAS domain S-box-containing protein n=1 Tax=Variovorax ginsengisoli TaxID=363844 RepID=A0ABT9S3J0_9BURK|nr:GGDEF domain-containing protein [Variovorax ginsengisoli]MDP9898905.1 diguanylate cyclase (GGDEF)-like protein/PAS domain S-box-containing protein [Variovorax ginsengisoli]
MTDLSKLAPNGQEFLSEVIERMVDAICVVDLDGRFIFVSAAARRIFGYEPEEMTGRQMIDFVCPEDRERTLAAARDVIAGQSQAHFENRYVRKDGTLVHIMWSAQWWESGTMRVGVARDVTERKRAESMQAALYAVSEAAHTAADLSDLFARAHEIIAGLLPASNFFVALYDRRSGLLSFPYYVDAYHAPPAPRALDSGTLSSEVIRTGKRLLLRSDAQAPLPTRVKVDMGTNSLDWLGVPLDGQGGPIGVLAVQSYTGDVRYTEQDADLLQFVSVQVASAIERKQMEERLRHIAWHDPLTDLPNRSLLHGHLQSSLVHARREGRHLSVLYLDLDTFKQVNDMLGHGIGDLLLQEAALRMKKCVGSADMVGRIGGDEFLILLDGDTSATGAVDTAELIRSILNQPFQLEGHRVRVSSSIGVARYPEHGADYKQLIRCADDAMYTAKKTGGNRVCVCANALHDTAQRAA